MTHEEMKEVQAMAIRLARRSRICDEHETDISVVQRAIVDALVGGQLYELDRAVFLQIAERLHLEIPPEVREKA